MGTMLRHTSLAMGITASELRAHRDRYDRACKRLLSEKQAHSVIKTTADITFDTDHSGTGSVRGS